MSLYIGASHETTYKGYQIVTTELDTTVYGRFDGCFCIPVADGFKNESDAMRYIDNL